MIYYELFGIIGLFLVILGIIDTKRRFQDLFYLCGGIFLLFYSIFIENWIFVLLQLVFTVAATYDILRLRTNWFKKHKKTSKFFFR